MTTSSPENIKASDIYAITVRCTCGHLVAEHGEGGCGICQMCDVSIDVLINFDWQRLHCDLCGDSFPSLEGETVCLACTADPDRLETERHPYRTPVSL